jgi:hypothetical protein
MALTDEQLLDAALIDLDNFEKRRLITLLRERLLKVNNQLKKQSKTARTGKDFVTTGTSVQPNVDLTKGPLAGVNQGSLQEQEDELSRKLQHAEASLEGNQRVIQTVADGSVSGSAVGGYKYVLLNEDEESGIVQFFQPGTEQPLSTGFLIYQEEDRAKPKVPGARRTITSTKVISNEQYNQQIFNEYYNDPQAVIEEKRRLIAAGLLPANTVVDGTADAPFRAAMTTLARKISTENYRRMQANPKARLFTLDTGLDYFTQRDGIDKKGTTTVTSISTKDEAYATLNSALAAYLGREATQDELSQFTTQLNTFEQANPEVQTTTGTGTTVTGGAQGAMGRMATEFARSQEGSAAFRAGTYYYDALLGAIDNPLF